MLAAVELPNPFAWLAEATVGKLVVDAWTSIMLAIWSGGVWFFRFVLNMTQAIMTPDLGLEGPAGDVYRVTFWMGGTLLIILLMVRIGAVAFRRDGQGLGRMFIGLGQFVLVWVAWLSYAGLVMASANGLSTAIMEALLGVDPWARLTFTSLIVSPEDLTDGVLATVLGFMGLFLWVGAIGYLLVMLTRAGALIILVATAPISAAGLVNDSQSSWFWKSFRWFHAAALTPVLIALVMGVGIKLTTGVVVEQGDGFAATLGTAIPGVVLICIACFSPLALFKLLAFTDPGTSSGAAMRAGFASAGGLSGVIAGGSSQGSTSTAASTTDQHGRSQAETSAEGDANARTAKATGSGLGRLGAAIGPAAGVAGGVAAAGLNAMVTAGTKGAVVGADLTNQMGVGANTYVPDFADRAQSRRNHPERRGENTEQDNGGQSDQGGSGTQVPIPAFTSPKPGRPGAGPGGPAGGTGGAGGVGAAGGAGGAAGAAGGAGA